MKPADAFRKAAQLIEEGRFLGCCNALIAATGSVHEGLAMARGPLADLLGYYAEDMTTYWWPIGGASDDELVTPRLIALELAALLSEEEQLSKSRKP